MCLRDMRRLLCSLAVETMFWLFLSFFLLNARSPRVPRSDRCKDAPSRTESSQAELPAHVNGFSGAFFGLRSLGVV